VLPLNNSRREVRVHHRRSVTALLVLVGAGFLLALAACSSVKVSHDSDGEASLAGFATFEVLASKSIQDGDLRAVIEILITDQLRRKGLTRADGAADLVVTYDGWTDGREQIASRLGYAVETTGGTTTVYTVSRGVPMGELIIALVDRAGGRVVWKARGQAALKPGAAPETRLRRLESAIAKMLAPYPARS
jgi:hypothetical protein